MSLAKKCDRCGKLYEPYSTGENSIRLIRNYKILDLCPECMKAFNEFMIDGGTEEREDNDDL